MIRLTVLPTNVLSIIETISWRYKKLHIAYVILALLNRYVFEDKNGRCFNRNIAAEIYKNITYLQLRNRLRGLIYNARTIKYIWGYTAFICVYYYSTHIVKIWTIIPVFYQICCMAIIKGHEIPLHIICNLLNDFADDI